MCFEFDVDLMVEELVFMQVCPHLSSQLPKNPIGNATFLLIYATENSMNADESQLLTTFLSQLSQVSGVTKDPQAAALIADAVARQPDAAYLLVQRALLQDQAINTARARIANLEAQLRSAPAASSSGSFLDGGSNAWGRSVNTVPSQIAAAPTQYAAAPAMAAPHPGFFGGGGFLTNMAATAAGVAGGAFLFQGIESMMHHGGGSHFMDQQANPFGGMANSVDNTDLSQSAPSPLESNDDNSDSYVDSDNSSSGGDDSNA